jgi:two-component system, NtrC family, C4-dicarboxylate transport response regulator DctD
MAHDWPGIVWELKNLADRLCLGLEQDTQAAAAPPVGEQSLVQQMDGHEKQLIEAALLMWQGHVGRVAEQLKIPRKTLYDKFTRHQIDPARFR